MPRQRKPSKKTTAPVTVSEAPAPDSTTFAPLDAPSGTRLDEKERAEQTQFKPLNTERRNG